MNAVHHIGGHRMVVEGDVAVVTINGSADEEDVRRMLKVYDGIVQRHGRYACLVFSAAMENVPPKSRRMLAEWPYAHTCYGIAIIGASFTVRTVIGLFVRAQYILGLSKAPTEFFKTEAEARAFLRKCRQQALVAEQSKHPS